MRTEPPVSLPSAKSQAPAATAAAEPLDEPPGMRPGARDVGRRAVMRVDAGDAVEELVADRLAGDGRAGVEQFLRPRAAVRCAPACACASQSGLPPPVRSPAMSYMSLTTAVRPASGPLAAPVSGAFEVVRDEGRAVERRRHAHCFLRAEIPVEDLLAVPARRRRACATRSPRRCAPRGRCGAAGRTDKDAGDRHDLRPLGRLRVETLELIHRARGTSRPTDGSAAPSCTMSCSSKLYGSATTGLCVVFSVTGSSSSTQSPIYSMPASREIIERVEGLRQARPEPAARRACRRISR